LNDLCYVGLHNFLLTTEMDSAFILNDSEIFKKNCNNSSRMHINDKPAVNNISTAEIVQL